MLKLVPLFCGNADERRIGILVKGNEVLQAKFTHHEDLPFGQGQLQVDFEALEEGDKVLFFSAQDYMDSKGQKAKIKKLEAQVEKEQTKAKFFEQKSEARAGTIGQLETQLKEERASRPSFTDKEYLDLLGGRDVELKEAKASARFWKDCRFSAQKELNSALDQLKKIADVLKNLGWSTLNQGSVKFQQLERDLEAANASFRYWKDVANQKENQRAREYDLKMNTYLDAVELKEDLNAVQNDQLEKIKKIDEGADASNIKLLETIERLEMERATYISRIRDLEGQIQKEATLLKFDPNTAVGARIAEVAEKLKSGKAIW